MGIKIFQLVFGYVRSLVVGPLIILNFALGMMSVLAIWDFVGAGGADLFGYFSELLPYLRSSVITEVDILFWYALVALVLHIARVMVQPYVGFSLLLPWKHKLWISSVFYFLTAIVVSQFIDLSIAMDFVGFAFVLMIFLAIFDAIIWVSEYVFENRESE